MLTAIERWGMGLFLGWCAMWSLIWLLIGVGAIKYLWGL